MREALIGQELSSLERLLSERGAPRFRAKQLYHALYRERLGSVDESTTLPKTLKAQLAEEFEWGLPDARTAVTSRDRTVRYLLGLADGKSVEAVFIPKAQRDTLCISSQVGCPVDCKFCLTALLGLDRHLTAGEIVGQTVALCRAHDLEPRNRPVNIVMMGMGEPLLNLDNVMQAVRLMADPDGMAIPLRRITVSTSGIIPKIEEFGRHEIRPKLAISLNASTQEQRLELMPITKKYKLDELLDARTLYQPPEREELENDMVERLRAVHEGDLEAELAALRQFRHRQVLRVAAADIAEALPLMKVSDHLTDEDAHRVVSLLAQLKAKVNLIALNPGDGIPFESPDHERVIAFQQIVERSLPCLVRRPRGRDIYAACGQLKRSAA